MAQAQELVVLAEDLAPTWQLTHICNSSPGDWIPSLDFVDNAHTWCEAPVHIK